ncbi:MAG: GNAT family acetyltransferase [Leptolyngbyaceae cyanobacterium SM1_1_3]|nr:GNAT family acetyltransferase [Leptolyngbyaceae cyanobacterium SM1_1_3]NJN04521.1 GNAT family acetyltransferase [Leptolyngbyaceae cyanobacterium RM1_1_2]NJO08394.1 GNAT family acetyltransferase [Leptolyngbyaceae cyanobacterium SL_1_1]
MQIRPFKQSDESAVVALWDCCGLLRPWNDPHQDIVRKLQVQPDLFLVGVLDRQIIATAMVGYDGHRGWINYFAVAATHRQQGYGHRLMSEVESRLHELGCPKINLQIRCDNLEAIRFYEQIGFEPDAVVSFGKRLLPD